MGKFSLKKKVCVLISWAVMLMCSGAEPQYFPQLRNLTWDEARNHCQVCFKNLVTLTPENIQTIAKKLTSDSWIGLRKRFYSTSNSTKNSTNSSTGLSWTRWATGDPLTFQNWYPGWPVFKSPFPRRDCCSCSCTCPAVTTTPRMTTSAATFAEFTTANMSDFSGLENVTDWSSIVNMTVLNVTDFGGWGNATTQSAPFPTTAAPSMLPVEAECMRSPMLLPDVPDPDENYIEDSCVAMLSFGPWVEKKCTDLLPFVCYDDTFLGQLNVTNVTTGSAVLEWLPGPSGISHYRLKVSGGAELTKELNNTIVTDTLVGLTAGTNYSVQVFPVKCERDLNPQEAFFYTTPNKVINLSVSTVTKNSIYLNWIKPAGNVDLYLIKFLGGPSESRTEDIKVDKLIPGNPYTFTVLSGVQNKLKWSEESSITAYTNPASVSNMMVSEYTQNSLFLHWVLSEGNATGYVVKAMNDSNVIFFCETVNLTEVNVTGLPMGTKITLNVTALAGPNHTVEGDIETYVSYTAPGQVSNLQIITTDNALNATWDPPEGSCSNFTVILEDDETRTSRNVKIYSYSFDKLKTAAKYTVTVYCVSGYVKGPNTTASNFTLPKPPTDLNATNRSADKITCEWKPPANAGTVKYSVKLNSSFWSHTFSELVNTTTFTFAHLMSGTKYNCEVQTVTDNMRSEPVRISVSTVPVKRQISLSMLCSSTEPLLCAESSTRESVLKKLEERFMNKSSGGIFLTFEKQNSEN